MIFKELMNLKDGHQVAKEVFDSCDSLLAGLKGLDKKPWIYPLDKPTEIGGTYYWLCDKSTMLYGALSINPDVQFYLQDKEGIIFRLTGKAQFTEDEMIIKAALKKGLALEYQIAFWLKDARITISENTESKSWLLKPADGTYTGISLKKDKEIRDRMARVIEERAQKQVKDNQLQKEIDGALLLFGEAVKKLWPSFNLMPLESSLLYETYDERESYRNKAAALLGNVSIKQPEDISYYLSEDTVRELFKK